MSLRVSIITPTHNTKHIQELYDSIKIQDFFEWIVVANGDVRFGDFSEEITKDKRVHILDYPEGKTQFVGALKRFGFTHAAGDILLEVDHDDVLSGVAIRRVVEAFEAHPEIGFVYSDCVRFRVSENGEWVSESRFMDGYGWEYGVDDDTRLEYPITFNPHPSAASRIWFAPDHLRAWRAASYNIAGGHNAAMRVLDDQDLMCRTYLVTDFHHIQEPLYYYRVTGDNTWIQRNAEIQNNVMPIYEKYISDMMLAWSNRNGLLSVELGPGGTPTPGYLGIDLGDGHWKKADLNDRWPLEDNSVGVIMANDIIEHLRDPIHTMKEMHRVLVHSGMSIIRVPSTDGRGAFQDPTHVSYWNSNSFLYYTNCDQSRFIGTPVRFQEVFKFNCFPSQYHQELNIPYVVAHLLALKEGPRPPGPIQI